MPLGLALAPEAFQNLMELMFSGFSYDVALTYLDDIIVFGKTFEEHLQRLEKVFPRHAEKGLKSKDRSTTFPKSVYNSLVM